MSTATNQRPVTVAEPCMINRCQRLAIAGDVLCADHDRRYRRSCPFCGKGMKDAAIARGACGCCLLGMAARRLPTDWEQRYAYRPVLLETFVEIARFAGTCYKAANWICVGNTKGRGKLDVKNEWAKPVKSIWLLPLTKRFRSSLCS